MSSMGAYLSAQNVKKLNDEILIRGPMYMSSEPIDIKVEFTIKGLESLKRQIYMRPAYYEIDKDNRHIYTFHCSKMQIMNYLFKFGWDAKVLEPADLRNEFKIR